MNNNLEKLVADTILQRASDVLVVDGIEFPIAPPTPATIILISELVATMPVINRNAESVLYEVLATAKDLSIIGKIAATLILGAKRIKEQKRITIEHTITTKRWSWSHLRYITEEKISVEDKGLELDYLADRILYEVSNKTLVEIVLKRLGMMQIADFFELTTSLSEANQLKRTKEVVETQYGV